MKHLVKFLIFVFVSSVSMLVFVIHAVVAYRLDEGKSEIVQETRSEDVDLLCFATEETEDMLPLQDPD